jgi:hypothetical protein
LNEAPASLADIPVVVWQKWAPITVAYPVSNANDDEYKAQQRLVGLVYQHAPAEIIDTLLAQLDHDNRESDHLYCLGRVEGSWDQRLGEALLTKAQDPALKPANLRQLLAALIDHQVPGAQAVAERLLSLPAQPTAEERNRAAAAGHALLVHAPDGGWQPVWTLFQQSPGIGTAIIESIAASVLEESAFGQRLAERELANLYVWLVQQYPFADDPDTHTAHMVGTREMVARIRDAILVTLKRLRRHQARFSN